MHTWDRIFVDGRWQDPAGDGRIEVRSPADGRVVGRVPAGTVADVDNAVAAARAAFDAGTWPATPAAQRADRIAAMSQALAARADELAALVTDEVGMPLRLSLPVQVQGALHFLDYYAELARTFPFEETRPGQSGPNLVVQEPVGVVGAIVPWNYPLFLTLGKVAPALAAGCTIVVKPAPETPLDAFCVAEAAEAAGLPPGVLNVVAGGGDLGARLVDSAAVDKISFTGSTAVGKQIMARCGDDVKRVTLELGGKSACIILDDADLDVAIPVAVNAALLNSGQTCTAQTRVLADRRVYEDVVDRYAARVAHMTVGDPREPASRIGPLVSRRQRDRVEGYVEAGIAAGARLVRGGGRPEGLDAGWYVEPTVFADVSNDMAIAREEIFGPVVVIIPFEGDEEAIEIANDSAYGLSGAVWSGDEARAVALARRIRTGQIAVNGLGYDPDVPFGGFKQSGIGRERGEEGLRPYLETKVVALPPR